MSNLAEQQEPAAVPEETDYQRATRTLIEEIRGEGHPVTGWFAGQQVLLLTTMGAKSGERRTSPLAFTRDNDRYVVIASKGGAPTHPAWFHNLLKDPTATIEVDREAFTARAEVPDGEERQRLWDQHVSTHPGIGEYPKKTDRVIPIVTFQRVA
ncbi:MAG: nitroreductase/quinone reductase family protein [Candidatus Limnocylindria bacterium]